MSLMPVMRPPGLVPAGSPAPVIVSSSSASSDGAAVNSLDVPIPAGIVEDIDYIFLASGTDTTVTGAPSASGFTFFTNWLVGSHFRAYFWYKEATAADEAGGDYTVSWSGAARKAVQAAFSLRGSPHRAPPIVNDWSNVEVETPATSIDLPAIETTLDNCILIAIVYSDWGTAVISPPVGEGWTKLLDAQGDDADGPSISIFYKEKPVAGAVAAQTFTQDVTEAMAGHLLAFEPA